MTTRWLESFGDSVFINQLTDSTDGWMDERADGWMVEPAIVTLNFRAVPHTDRQTRRFWPFFKLIIIIKVGRDFRSRLFAACTTMTTPVVFPFSMSPYY